MDDELPIAGPSRQAKPLNNTSSRASSPLPSNNSRDDSKRTIDGKPKSKTKTRIKGKQAVTVGAETTSITTSAISSSSSTPKLSQSVADVDDQAPEPRPKSEKKDKQKEKEKDKSKKRKKKRKNLESSSDQGGGKNRSENKHNDGDEKTRASGFESVADFIALVDSDDEDDVDEEGGRSWKGKEREERQGKRKHSRSRSPSHSRERRRDRDRDRDRGRDRDWDRDGDRDWDRDRDRDWDRDRDRDRDREREKDRKSKGRDQDREWDRGKRRRRESDYDRDYRDQRERRRYEQPISATVKSLGNRKLPWLEGLDLSKCNNVAELLHKEVSAFTNWISPSPVEHEIRNLLIHQITTAIKRRFPDAEVHPFGSFATKLYLPSGDIDLVVLSQTMLMTDKHTVLRSLAEVIKRNGIAASVSVIAKARVPIIKFVTTNGRIPVDVSINQENGIAGVEVVNGFLRNLHPSSSPEGSLALRSLILFTKLFLAQRSMNSTFTGGLSSYSLLCLALSFLQMHPKIRRGEIDPDENLGVLLVEFFELYGRMFNYGNVGISVRDGGRYFDKAQRGWGAPWDVGGSGYRGKERGGGLLSIEDPIDVSNDISSGSYAFPKVRATFAGAHQILTATAYLKAEMLSARKTRASYRDRDRDRARARVDDDDDYDYYRPESLSVLRHVVDITQDIINHRRLVQEVYDRRVLHDLLNIEPLIQAKPKPEVTSAPGTSSATAIEVDLEDGEIPIPIVISSDHEPENEPETLHSRKNTKERHSADDGRTLHRRKREEYSSGSDRTKEEEVDEEQGKYGISRTGTGMNGRNDVGRPPPKKRLKVNGEVDMHTVFVSDEDTSGVSDNSEEDDDGEHSSGLSAEEAEYDLELDMDSSARVDAGVGVNVDTGKGVGSGADKDISKTVGAELNEKDASPNAGMVQDTAAAVPDENSCHDAGNGTTNTQVVTPKSGETIKLDGENSISRSDTGNTGRDDEISENSTGSGTVEGRNKAGRKPTSSNERKEKKRLYWQLKGNASGGVGNVQATVESVEP
ncbi:hypothetical protein EV361DRAFT_966740 [Lentinula raphanica]|nr:hypothetical protein EV361DRAFT_966740 [Lentinula raphanica]